MNIAATRLPLPPLRSGGLMLGYRCTQRCRHCAYRSGPDAGEWMTDAVLDAVVERLAGEKHLVDLHIGGGEATLNMPLLLRAVAKLKAAGVRMSYLETNAHFAATPDRAREVLAPLRDAGLPGVLVSVSPYHNEFIPLARTLHCLNVAEEVFGLDGVFPWLGHFIPMLSRLDPEVPHSLEEFLAANDLQPGDPRLLGLFPLTPGGRAPDGLGDFFPRRPAGDYRGGHCADILANVSHFHIDPEGRLFTGHCPGLTADSMLSPEPQREVRGAERPLFMTLATGGPYALMETAAREAGFSPDPAGYISPCHLCFAARRALAADGRWPELGPAIFYKSCTD